jgi:hypothetical protein
MANTEGMPDEFIESLMTLPATTTTTTSRSRLQERMELPMGSRPAAKVIRSSPQVRTTTTIKLKKKATRITPPKESSSPLPEPPTAPPVAAFAMVGSVVERSTPADDVPTPNNRATGGKKLSRFAQQQKQQQQHNTNGFPSVHVPLGTFVTKKTRPRPLEQKPPHVLATPLGASTSASPSTSAKTNNTNSISSLMQASGQEADGMLAGMSTEEIQDAQQELQASISPEMKAFLQQRAAKKKQQPKAQANTQRQPQRHMNLPAPTTLPQPTMKQRQPTTADEMQEKQRLAKLVSSVQTHQDLDQAYQTEMQQGDGYGHGLNNNDKKTKEGGTVADFQMACSLLRSTVPRQNLWASKVVRDVLVQKAAAVVQQQQSSPEMATEVLRDWPVMLPVSLRCLLDQSPTANGFLVHTYVLQSLESLVVLGTTMMTTTHGMSRHDNDDETLEYQLVYMDDAVPTLGASAFPSVSVQPLVVDKEQQQQQPQGPATEAAAYATSSSSTSANQDGQAFETDPLWTLLSKMRILPRLAQLLEHVHVLPQEAVISICGILKRLCQRSPGAASAIAHHPTLVKRIFERTLQQPTWNPNDDNADDNQNLALNAMILYCTLARQSRVVAETLNIDEWLPQVLATTATTDSEFRLQQLALVLWRTNLRYGLGLSSLSDLLTLAAKHLALPYSAPFSLSTSFVSALTQVLECTKVVLTKNNAQDVARVISQDQLQVLYLTPSWLSSTRRLVLSAEEASPSLSSEDSTQQQRQWNAARLRFLAAFWSLTKETTVNHGGGEIKAEDVSMEEEVTILEALHEWTDPEGQIHQAWKEIAKYAAVTDWNSAKRMTDTASEASCCAYLESIASMIVTIEKSTSQKGNSMVRGLTKTVVGRFTEHILQGLKSAKEQEMASSTETISSKGVPSAQRGWVNQCHFTIAKFLAHSLATEVITSSADICLVRMFVFSLLGRLERGNESMAAVLFSIDSLFQPNSNPLDEQTASPISSMFLGELCGSDRARKQLDHSFKLQKGFGITSDGFGPFMLDSLLSDADQPGPTPHTSELVLPVGKLWLWQALSGVVQMKDQAVVKGINEAANVVSACLKIVLELEQEEDSSEEICFGYASRIPLGAKLYYLMNVCLHPEEVLRDDRVVDSAEAVVDRYLHRLDRTSVHELSKACLQHTAPAKKRRGANEEEDKLDEKDQLLMSMFNPESSNDAALSSEEMRSLEALLEDLSSAYTDYGAQYNFFTKCIRLFLVPVFPSVIRCRTMQELRGILHLLTLSGESEDLTCSEMVVLLGESVAGGLPQSDGSARDPSDVLDMATSLLSQGGSTRPLDGYMLCYTLSSLVRNLATSFSESSAAGLEASKKRLLRLDAVFVEFVLEATSAFLATDGTRSDLVNAILKPESLKRLEAPQGEKVKQNDLDVRLSHLGSSS